MTNKPPLLNPRLLIAILLLGLCALAYVPNSIDSNLGQIALAQGSGDPDPTEYAGGDGYSCEEPPDPCGGDPCCGDPCCGDPECCGDFCCEYPEASGCGEDCYEYCWQVCGDNETCLDEDPETNWCYLWASDVCWEECRIECY